MAARKHVKAGTGTKDSHSPVTIDPNVDLLTAGEGAGQDGSVQTDGLTLPSFLPPVGGIIFDTSNATLNTSQNFLTGLLGLINLGQSFTTGASQSVLNDVKLDLADGSPLDGGTLTIELFSDTGGPGPGTLIATLGTVRDSALSNTNQLIDFTVSGGPTLAAGTRYWVEAVGSGVTVGGRWDATNNPAGTVEGATEYNQRLGAGGLADVISPDTGGLLGNFAYGMQVTTTNTCFAAGTRILTARGEVPVESLRPGDRAMALRRGVLSDIVWIGRRDVDLRDHPRAGQVAPVRILAGAFGDDLPHRDLVVSLDHALFIDGALIAARYLVNGATILREMPECVTYYHVELASHDVLLVEGVGAESFLDVGNRSAFAAGGGNLVLHPDFSMQGAPDPDMARRIWEEKSCAPSITDDAERRALHRTFLDRAIIRGHALVEDPDVRLRAGGQSLQPEMTEAGAVFRLPPDAGSVQLLSRHARPAEMGLPGNDGRMLGVGVTRLMLDDRAVDLDDLALSDGWYQAEGGLRWTDGCANIETDGAATLTLTLHPGMVYWAGADRAAERLAA